MQLLLDIIAEIASDAHWSVHPMGWLIYTGLADIQTQLRTTVKDIADRYNELLTENARLKARLAMFDDMSNYVVDDANEFWTIRKGSPIHDELDKLEWASKKGKE